MNKYNKAEMGHPCLIPRDISHILEIHPLFYSKYWISLQYFNTLK